jgi:CheY-like chemotaxis protein
MISAARIRGTAEQGGVHVDFVRSIEALVEAAGRTDAPALIVIVIVDLHTQRLDPFAVAERMKADGQMRDMPLVGFFSHVETELRRRARAAGFDHVFPRSAFTKRLPEILRGNFGVSSE